MFVAFVAFVVSICAPMAAQSAVVGKHPLTPGLLHPDLLENLPVRGRELDGGSLDLHESVSMRVELRPGRRGNAFEVVGNPGRFRKKLVVPGLLNVPLRYGKKRKRTHRFAVQMAGATLSVTSHSGTILEVERHTVAFVDLDHDGAFGGPGDGWVYRAPKVRRWTDARGEVEFRPHSQPWELGSATLWFRVAPDGFSVEVTDQKPDFRAQRLASYETALVYLNELRAELGHAPVTLDAALSDGCEAHARYCAARGEITHDEAKDDPHYTPAGAIAGKHGNLMETASMKRAVRFWLDTFYHRIPMLSPQLSRVGMGCIDGMCVMDVQSALGNESFEPYMWPPHGATGGPAQLAGGRVAEPDRSRAVRRRDGGTLRLSDLSDVRYRKRRRRRGDLGARYAGARRVRLDAEGPRQREFPAQPAIRLDHGACVR